METTIPQIVLQRWIRGRALVNVLTIIGASLLIALAAQVAIPIPGSPVPLTLQPIAVLLVGVTLGSTRGAAAAALYLLEGASGLPVFAQGNGGILWLTVGLPAGYLYSYPFAAWLAGFISERGWASHVVRAVAGMLAALLVIYLGGWSWLAAHFGASKAFAMGIGPFFVADIVKVALAASLLPYAQKLVSRHS
jgi:biotin transport system substrate-specific component